MDWVTIDGRLGEGGGQILRTALSLSCLTGRPFRISHIRAGRKNPGLRPQHLTAVRAVQKICSAIVSGDRVNSTELEFQPGPIGSGEFLFDISEERLSAGSISLIFQTVLPVLLFADTASRVGFIRGGTCVAFSPPIPYLSEVFLPTVGLMGATARLEITRAGWYPRGGGAAFGVIYPMSQPLRPLTWTKRGELKSLRIQSLYSALPTSVGTRQADRARQRLAQAGFSPSLLRVEIRQLPADSPGTCLFLIAEFETGRAGFSALGALGKSAEQVADEAVDAFFEYWHQGAPVDRHLSDQLLLFLALAEGPSTIRTTHLTLHALTNISVIKSFLDVPMSVSGEQGQLAEIAATGAGFLRQNRVSTGDPVR